MNIPEQVIASHDGTLPTQNTLHWNVLLSEFTDSNSPCKNERILKFLQKTFRA